MKKQLYDRLKKKASKHDCTNYRIVAVGFNSKNELLGITINRPAYNRFYRKTHAECLLIDRYGRNLSKIVIARFGRAGDQLPIKPCPMCQAYADSFGIKIETI